MDHQGEALSNILRRLGVNLSTLAAKIGVSRSAIYLWMDKDTISLDNLDKISNALQMDIYEEIQKEMKVKSPIKKYQPVATVEEPRAVYETPTPIQVLLDGDDEHFERLVAKLKALNDALKVYHAQLEG
jgi:transcriptional regulator with XRE-family HTH domain